MPREIAIAVVPSRWRMPEGRRTNNIRACYDFGVKNEHPAKLEMTLSGWSLTEQHRPYGAAALVIFGCLYAVGLVAAVAGAVVFSLRLSDDPSAFLPLVPFLASIPGIPILWLGMRLSRVLRPRTISMNAQTLEINGRRVLRNEVKQVERKQAPHGLGVELESGEQIAWHVSEARAPELDWVADEIATWRRAAPEPGDARDVPSRLRELAARKPGLTGRTGD